MILFRRVRTAFFVMAIAAALAACEKEGPAERAGEEVDKAVEQMGESMEKAGDKAQDATQR